MKMTVHVVGAEPQYITMNSEQTILDALQGAGITIYAPCGGKGRCHRCSVLVKDSAGMAHKLACQTRITEDSEVFFEGTGSIMVEGVNDAHTGHGPEDYVGPYGVGIDVGTTTIVFHLVDIGAGRIIATSGTVNPQVIYGGDVLSRIQNSQTPEGFDNICSLLRTCVNDNCAVLCQKTGIPREDIGEIYLVGNTVMEHFAAGLDPTPIGVSPFTPRSLFGEPRALYTPVGQDVLEATLAPAVAGYVGGDITAGISITDMLESEDLQLFIDIGTNGEMALGNADRMTCCATAAGPAFEGACIKLGMPAMPGAVNKVSLDDSGFHIKTIEDGTPVGICGSGVLDAIACMIDAGIVDETGRILGEGEVPARFAPCIERIDNANACVIDEESRIFITQGDVREIQLAKAAIRGGIETLLDTLGKTSKDIADLLLAGGFGMSLDPHSAARIGLYPPELEGKVKPLGNAAGKGAAASVMSDAHKERVKQVARECEYIELSTSAIFNDHYMEAMMFEPDQG